MQAAQDEVYWAAMDLARNMVEAMHAELDRGTGFRYSISLFNCPNPEDIQTALSELSGYVRMNVDVASSHEMLISYWSNLQSDTLLDKIRKKLDEMGVKYMHKMDGRSIKFKWQQEAS